MVLIYPRVNVIVVDILLSQGSQLPHLPLHTPVDGRELLK